MNFLAVNSPYQIFTDTDGEPLEAGYIYIGEAYKNPITNPIDVYWDRNFLYPAAQPIRTISGYARRNGSPANIFTNDNYSITVLDKNSNIVFLDYNYVANSSLGTVFNVRWFGARGDGITDDTEAIKTCWNAMSNIDAIYFPRGNYLWNGSQQLEIVSGDAKNIIGDGSGTSILKIADGTDVNFLKVSGNARFWSIKGVKITGPTVTTPTSGNVIEVDTTATSDGVIEDVMMRGGKFNTCIKLRKANQIYMSKIELFEAQEYHLLCQGALNVFIDQFVFNGVDKTGVGVRIAATASLGNSEAVVMTNGIITNTAESLTMVGTTMDPSTDGRNLQHKFTNVYFDDSLNAGADLNYAVSCQFDTCYFASNGGFGAHLRNTEYISFINCCFTKNENDGLYIESDSKYTTVIGGEASDNDDLAAGTFAGIDIESNTEYFKIIGVTFAAQTNLYNKDQDYGLTIGNSCDNFIVKDNIFDGNLTGNVINNGGYSSTQIFKDNIGWVTENYGDANVSPDANGNANVAHGIDVTPSFANANITGNTTYHVDVEIITSVNLTLRIKDSSGADVTSGTYNIKWQAKA